MTNNRIEREEEFRSCIDDTKNIANALMLAGYSPSVVSCAFLFVAATLIGASMSKEDGEAAIDGAIPLMKDRANSARAQMENKLN